MPCTGEWVTFTSSLAFLTFFLRALVTIRLEPIPASQAKNDPTDIRRFLNCAHIEFPSLKEWGEASLQETLPTLDG